MRRVGLREIYNFRSTNFRLQIQVTNFRSTQPQISRARIRPSVPWLKESGWLRGRNEKCNLKPKAGIFLGLWVLCALFMLSPVWLFVTPWTIAHQAPLSMGFSRQEHWSGLPYSLSGYLPDPGVEPASLMSPELAGGFFTTSATYISRAFGF